MNSSSLPFDVEELVPRPITLPFYHTPAASVLPFMSDVTLGMVAPIAAYWAYSLFFHALDTLDLLPAARIHPPEEIAKRNRATRTQVVTAVLFQQLIQFVTGLLWFSGDTPDAQPSHADAMRAIAGPVARGVLLVLGQENGLPILRQYGPRLVEFTYWWGIPGAQLALGMFVMDTWQYFLHRAMHVNKFLYRHCHSVHHRLYVPYAYGALYNHPVEGFLLDTLGGAISEAVAGMTLRQAAFFFTVSTMKTVDDHCGYRLLLDPFQFFFANTADYHDIHHQHAGIKYNFSQPFFIHWDDILGTRMSREQYSSARKTKKLPEKEL